MSIATDSSTVQLCDAASRVAKLVLRESRGEHLNPVEVAAMTLAALVVANSISRTGETPLDSDAVVVDLYNEIMEGVL